MWEALRERYASTNLGNRASLHRKLCTMSSNSFKTLEDYVSKVEEMADETACIHLLKGLDPQRYQAFLDGIEARDADTITFSWLASKIRNLNRAPERPERAYNVATPKNIAIKCRFCHADWHKRCPNVICRECQGKGHFAKDCPSKNKIRLKSHSEKVNWVLDSGATSSMTSDETELVDLEVIPQRRVTVANGHVIACTKKGKLRLKAQNGAETVLEDVLVVPGLKEKLISVRSLQNYGYKVTFGKEGCRVKKDGRTIITGRDGLHGLYEIHCLMARTDDPRYRIDTLKGWHERLGHVSDNQILKLTKNNNVIGIKVQRGGGITCQACAEGKQTNTPHQRKAERIPERPGELISTHVIGPIRPLGCSREKFISVVIDHYTGWTDARPMMTNSTEGHSVHRDSDKSESANPQDRLCGGIPDRSFREMDSSASNAAPDDSTKVQRLNRTLTELIRTQMAAARVEPDLWPYAAVNAAYLINRTTISPCTKKTPYEKIFGIPPNLCHSIAFGKACYMKIEHPQHKLSYLPSRHRGQC